LTDHAFVEQSALGLLRNFGDKAAAKAESLARKYAASRHADAEQLWAAIAETIRKLDAHQH
jgi:hypothetical protein